MRHSPRNIPHRNRSPYGWCIAAYLQRFEYDDEDKTNSSRRCFAWENTILLKAKDRDGAYAKARRIGRESNDTARGPDGRKGKFRFEGLTLLLPVYEELGDGAEVLWRERSNIAVRTVRALVKRKAALAVFDDTAGSGDAVPSPRARGASR
ncbi:MAG: DUF4288 domain-containing protein [bacterium]